MNGYKPKNLKVSSVDEGFRPIIRISKTSPDGPASARLRPLKRLDLVQEVVNQMREQIISGELESGRTMLPEGRLCETLGVSRTVVREAMRMGAQGLVEVSQGRRPRVRPADPQTVVETFGTYLQRGDHSLLDLIEVRCPLEAEIAALAAKRSRPPQIKAMQEAIDIMASASSLEEQGEADVLFHSLLTDASGNPLFPTLLKTLAGAMRRSRHKTLAQTGVDRALHGHRAVLAAIRNGDPEAARTAMLEHLGMAEEELREIEK